jgi:putative flippase GtrA
MGNGGGLQIDVVCSFLGCGIDNYSTWWVAEAAERGAPVGELPEINLANGGLGCLGTGATAGGGCASLATGGTRIMQSRTTSPVRRLFDFARNGHLIKFLAVGGASFAIDLGLLTLLHEVFMVDLWVATPVAFLVSLVFNFFVQKKFTFESDARAHVSFLKYGALVIFNLVATDVIVNLIAGAGQSYALGKVAATVLTTAWNFLLYKHWIFKEQASAMGEGLDLTPLGAPASSHEDHG